MKKTTMLFAGALAFAAFAGAGISAAKDAKETKGHAHHAGHGEAAEKKVTLKGEVIDLSCYMAHEGKGAKHAKCAKSCLLDKGLPAGLLTDDGKVYFLVEDHAAGKAYKQVKELAAEKVEISGKQYARGGAIAVAVKSVKKL